MAQVAGLLVLMLLWVAWTQAAPPKTAPPRSARGASEDLPSSIRWEYGGWRPIMPGSPFFFVKTSRAVPLDNIASASGQSSVSVPIKNDIKDDSKVRRIDPSPPEILFSGILFYALTICFLSLSNLLNLGRPYNSCSTQLIQLVSIQNYFS